MKKLHQAGTPTSSLCVRGQAASLRQPNCLPMSLTWLYASLLSFLKNGFSWVNRILTSSMETMIILELINGYNVYIPCGNKERWPLRMAAVATQAREVSRRRPRGLAGPPLTAAPGRRDASDTRDTRQQAQPHPSAPGKLSVLESPPGRSQPGAHWS